MIHRAWTQGMSATLLIHSFQNELLAWWCIFFVISIIDPCLMENAAEIMGVRDTISHSSYCLFFFFSLSLSTLTQHLQPPLLQFYNSNSLIYWLVLSGDSLDKSHLYLSVANSLGRKTMCAHAPTHTQPPREWEGLTLFKLVSPLTLSTD